MDTTIDQTAIDRLVLEAAQWAQQGQWPKTREVLLQIYALGYKPGMTAQHIGDAWMNEGQNLEAIRWHRTALDHDPRLYQAQEHLIFLLDAQQESTDADTYAERRNWWRLYGEPAYALRQPYRGFVHPEKRLRVGYVSGDFNFHSAAIAFVPVVTKHSSAIEPFFFSTLEPARYDHRTQLWQEWYGDHFVDCHAMSAGMLAEMIRVNTIDLLVDLSGYTGNNRLVTFAMKPAPIQIQAWGYVLGTASPAIDVIFADPIVATPQIRANLHERVVDLPALLSYLPRPDLPEANALPCETTAPLFSVFMRAMKVTSDAIATWREILLRVPDATIMFKGPDYSPARRTWIADQFGDCRTRISFDFQTDHREHMLWYQSIDLALDTWPQTGGVSTLEALWMGVPTVTLIGDRMIQRASASFLTLLGLEDFIAHDRAAYVENAVQCVTTGRDRLAQVRRETRARMVESPIMNGYVDAVETQYRALWREYCAAQEKAA